MAVLVQQKAPSFNAEAVMEDGSFKQIKLEDYRGKYVLLFFYPLDFTFVCPTEIIAFSDRGAEFQQLGVQILGVSVDSKFSHLAWRNTPRKTGGIGDVSYPLIADLKKGEASAVMSRRFHDGLAEALARMCVSVRELSGLSLVALSGGCFQNAFLHVSLEQRLQAAHFEVLSHRQVPANDGGVSLGQAVIANAEEV